MTPAERIATALERIVVLLEGGGEPAAAVEPIECLHPIEQRTDFGTTDGEDDWQCNVCGYRTVTP